MSDQKQPGLTFSIPEIMETITNKLNDTYTLEINCYCEVFIADMSGELELDFGNLEELHRWVAKTRIELDEQEAEQLKENHNINAKSANVDIMKQRW